jgi:excisionase family DNA binding protein
MLEAFEEMVNTIVELKTKVDSLSNLEIQITALKKQVSELAKNTHNQSDFLDINEAAKYLHLPKGSMYNLCSSKKITYTKLGKKNLFKLADLQSYASKYLIRSKSNIALNYYNK